ncbi:MAG: type IV toxin-antitoxin system AbiEi family antitoxin domain-containing protein [Gammaproteobacteria bacterium]
MAKLEGIGKLDRERLTSILRETQTTISVEDAVKVLGVSRDYAAKLLAKWAVKGWLARVSRGVYIAVPIESTTADIRLEDPWAVAEKLFHPCYIGGWSAAEHWGLTEQIFRTIIVLTTQKPRNQHLNIRGTHFWLRMIPKENMFGLKAVWHEQIKIFVSDQSRTILDFLIDPKLGGGIRHVIDMFREYLKTEHKNLPLLMEYVVRLDTSAVFKRLGFLLEQNAPEEKDAICICEKHITISKTKLDPQLKDSNKLITRWRLWVPENWKV